MISHSAPQAQSSEIRPDCLYRFTDVCRRMGWSATAARTARRNGLQLKYAGGKAYLMGSELIRHILEKGKDHK